MERQYPVNRHLKNWDRCFRLDVFRVEWLENKSVSISFQWKWVLLNLPLFFRHGLEAQITTFATTHRRLLEAALKVA